MPRVPHQENKFFVILLVRKYQKANCKLFFGVSVHYHLINHKQNTSLSGDHVMSVSWDVWLFTVVSCCWWEWRIKTRIILLNADFKLKYEELVNTFVIIKFINTFLQFEHSVVICCQDTAWSLVVKLILIFNASFTSSANSRFFQLRLHKILWKYVNIIHLWFVMSLTSSRNTPCLQ